MIRREITIAAVIISILLVSATGFARDRGRSMQRSAQRQGQPNLQRRSVSERPGEVQRRPVSGTAGEYQQLLLPGPPGGARPPVTSENLEQMRGERQRQQYLRQQEVDRALHDDDTRNYDVGEDYFYPQTTITPAIPQRITR